MKKLSIVFFIFCCSFLNAKVSGYKKDPIITFTDEKVHRFPYQDQEPHLFVASFPHSGSHFFMYMVQYFSRRVWQVPRKRYFFHLDRIDKKLSPYYRCHSCTDTDFYNRIKGYFFPYVVEKDKLILLLRNYKENCFNKSRYIKYQDSSQFEKILRSGSRQYLNLLRCFDRWPEERRLLIRYEDLIKSPEKVLRQALEFLEVEYKEREMHEFFTPKKFQFHRLRCMKLMEILNGGPSISKGKSTRFHAGYAKQEILDQIDCHFEEAAPDLFNRYLEEYRE
ncbi:MAG: sulfotransferase [Candidatus Algichlamydia australiensis]|nr:sulfotransferase [Chlamydiales bacterium]